MKKSLIIMSIGVLLINIFGCNKRFYYINRANGEPFGDNEQFGFADFLNDSLLRVVLLNI